MSFSDEQLKRLKERTHIDGEQCTEYCDPTCKTVLALLARLEAAEAVVNGQSGHDEDCDEVNGWEMHVRLRKTPKGLAEIEGRGG